jgi:hypothetical protein
MLLFQSLFLISLLLTINAQWYIKKSYRTQPMNYPNPGKRSIPDQEPVFVEIDCSTPYSRLHSYQKAAWIITCGYETLSTTTNEYLSPFDSNNLQIEFSSTPARVSIEKRSLHVVPPYIKEHDNSFNRFSKKYLRRLIQNK